MTSSTARVIRSSRLVRASRSAACLGAAICLLRCFCFFDQSGEASLVVEGDLGQHLAIQFDSALLQTAHEPAVGHAGIAARGADADDPEGPEIALLETPSF